jgi:hypothetical protein
LAIQSLRWLPTDRLLLSPVAADCLGTSSDTSSTDMPHNPQDVEKNTISRTYRANIASKVAKTTPKDFDDAVGLQIVNCFRAETNYEVMKKCM